MQMQTSTALQLVVPVARYVYNACDFAWYRWEKSIVAACGVTPVACHCAGIPGWRIPAVERDRCCCAVTRLLWILPVVFCLFADLGWSGLLWCWC